MVASQTEHFSGQSRGNIANFRVGNRNPDHPAMRVAVYCLALLVLSVIAWQYPFLFELPLVAAIGGAYWAFFAEGNGGQS